MTTFQRIVDQAYDIDGSRTRCAEAVATGQRERLDAFLAAKGDQRAAIWRQATVAQRRELVINQALRVDRDVTESWINWMIDRLDIQYGN